jgi:hypothetical protein
MGSCRDGPRNARGSRKGSAGQLGMRKANAWNQAALLMQQAAFERAEAFVAELQVDLAEAARCHAIAVAIIGELAAF